MDALCFPFSLGFSFWRAEVYCWRAETGSSSILPNVYFLWSIISLLLLMPLLVLREGSSFKGYGSYTS